MGYVYAFSTESMPGIFKIGMTERTPEKRLSEANGSDEFKPPLPYVIAIYKKVNNCKETEKKIHALLSDKRINPHREFFKITIEELNEIFNNIDGENETDIVLEKEKEFIDKVNNDIFDVLSTFKINNISFNKCFIELNHETKEYNYQNYSSNNLVHIINIIVSIKSHIFGNDMLEHYALHYIKKSKGKLVKYGELKDHFRNWTIVTIGEENYYKHSCLKLLYAYTSKNYICNSNSIFDP